MANSKSSEKEMDGKVLYYQPARGNGKSLLSIVNYCKAQGMTDEEIIELWDKAIERLRGDADGVLE